jgi:hypothetical protein
MTILSRSTKDLDLYRLKGRLDASSFAQIQFILERLSGSRTMQFDFRRVNNMDESCAVFSLQSMLDTVPCGSTLVLSGIPQRTQEAVSVEGTTNDVFI